MNQAKALAVIDRDELRAFLSEKNEAVLSMYFSTTRVAVEPEENSLRLKGLLGRAEDRLLERGLRRSEVEDFLRPAVALLDDNDFWVHQLEGLALFSRPDDLRFYKLPFDVPETLHIGESPYVRHLFPALFPHAHFYVLALSQHLVKLLECTRHGCHEVDLSGHNIPGSLDEALQYDDFQKPELQHHPTTGPGRTAAGHAPAPDRSGGRQHAFHGHGDAGDEPKTRIRRFLQAVDDGMSKLLASATSPLVIAGVDYMRSFYRDVSSYRSILDEGVDGNPDRVSDQRLHELALPIIERRLQGELDAARERYGTAKARGLASSELDAVLGAAHDGRVDTLFVRRDVVEWGSFDPRARTLHRHPEAAPRDVDLLDLASRQVFMTSGSVYELAVEDMPEDANLAALYRY